MCCDEKIFDTNKNIGIFDTNKNIGIFDTNVKISEYLPQISKKNCLGIESESWIDLSLVFWSGVGIGLGLTQTNQL